MTRRARATEYDVERHVKKHIDKIELKKKMPMTEQDGVIMFTISIGRFSHRCYIGL